MNFDHIYNILLHLDILTIISFQCVSKRTSIICDTNFWLTKFQNDNLPIIDIGATKYNKKKISFMDSFLGISATPSYIIYFSNKKY